MIKGFENITSELTEWETEILLPMVTAKLCTHKGKANIITNARLIEYCRTRGIEQPLSQPRIRKIIEHIRHNFLLDCLVANGNGYFIAVTPEEMESWLMSIKQRRNALDKTYKAGMSSYKKMTGLKQPNQYTRGKMKPGKSPQQFLFNNQL